MNTFPEYDVTPRPGKGPRPKVQASDRTPAQAPSREQTMFYRVEVSDHDGQIVSIEPRLLAGRDIGPAEDAAIRAAIESLCGFIGLSPAIGEASGAAAVPTSSDAQITIRELEAQLTASQGREGWVCFHCGEVFTTMGAARDHFGETPENTAGCLIDRVALEEGGKSERGRGLLMALRKAEAEIKTLRAQLAAAHELERALWFPKQLLDRAQKAESQLHAAEARVQQLEELVCLECERTFKPCECGRRCECGRYEREG